MFKLLLKVGDFVFLLDINMEINTYMLKKRFNQNGDTCI